MSDSVTLHLCHSPVLSPSLPKLSTNRTPAIVDVDECEVGFLYAMFSVDSKNHNKHK